MFHNSLFSAYLLAVSAASAAIDIHTVLVGNAGNDNDTTGYGAVNYDYHIGTYEVTNSQYTAFLNATATTDIYSLYNSSMSTDSLNGGIERTGTDGSYSYSVKAGFDNKPVNYVSFWDAARFSNWLTTGGTETGVYNLGGATDLNNASITRDATAWSNGGVAVASENEWYKAAYYDGDGSYWRYPTQSDTISTDEVNYGNSVVIDGGTDGTVTDVGTYSSNSSYYGTFDQGGNLYEWSDTLRSGDRNRGLRGGSFSGKETGVRSTYRNYNEEPTVELVNVGFRVSSLSSLSNLSSVPEPSAYAGILGCLALALAMTRRKGCGTL